jgi:hypothetical protein
MSKITTYRMNTQRTALSDGIAWCQRLFVNRAWLMGRVVWWDFNGRMWVPQQSRWAR